ncbi:MAG: hypothetical protein U5K28_11445 [Halobacteriales archaeon]|nr:hypothetical protein [Halobacteriales archaeon]
MPSIRRIHVSTGFVLFGVITLLYSWILGYDPLVGTAVAVASFVVALLTYYGDADRLNARSIAIIAVTLIYGVFTFQLPIAAHFAACVVYLTGVAHRFR